MIKKIEILIFGYTVMLLPYSISTGALGSPGLFLPYSMI